MLPRHYATKPNHWRKDDRLVLLDIADEAIRPVEMTIDKAKLMRMVKREPNEDAATKLES